MKDESNSKVIPFPARFLTGALVLTGVVLVALVWFIFDSYRNATTEQLRDLRIEELRGAIVHFDEVLTMSARMAAATGDSDWERRYRQFEPQLDAAIKEAMLLTAHSESAQAAAQTDAANLKLVEMENRSFALVRAGDAGKAKAVLFADAYEAQKKIYAEGMLTLIQRLKEQLTTHQRKKQREAFVLIIAVAVCIVLLLSTWLSVLRKLKYWRAMQAASLDAVTRAEEALRKLNDGLEKRVEDRTRSLELEIRERKRSEADLEKAHKDLLETSRQAGMAEVATGILHNVGNVLNSVNVASSCLAESLKRSKAANLSKVVAMLREHEADLGTFLTSDSKGKQLPGYLAQLAEHLAGEQTDALKELKQLQKNIEHIKDIVTMQQGLARTGTSGSPGITETVNVTDLVEDALRMNLSALVRHDIDVIKEFNDKPLVTVEKHKVLQILVNLVRNAKEACEASDHHGRKLTIRTTGTCDSPNGLNRVRIAVSDNGLGILKENLIRIFSHGFTTKKDGHGFGLHSAALAAKEMGGSLSVQSDGPGHGAAFTLELPCATLKSQHE